MATIVEAWVSKTTGLPSFRIEGAGELRTSEGRLVGRSSSGSWSCSDVFAPVGVGVEYTAGEYSEVVTRAPFGPDGSCLISDLTGRGLVVDFHEDIGEPYKFKTGASRFTNGRVRTNPRGDTETGEARLVLDSPEQYEALTKLLKRPGRKLLTLGAPALGVRDVKCFWVTDIDRVRTSTTGEFQFSVKYEWQDSDDLADALVPTVTFGEIVAAGVLWGTDKTFDEICRMVSGGGM